MISEQCLADDLRLYRNALKWVLHKGLVLCRNGHGEPDGLMVASTQKRVRWPDDYQLLLHLIMVELYLAEPGNVEYPHPFVPNRSEADLAAVRRQLHEAIGRQESA